MSLRARIAAVAGLAVAVTVLLGATAAYVAVRSDLRGEVARALRERASTSVAAISRAATANRQPDPDQAGRPDPDADRDERYGGAPGREQRILPSGAIQRSGADTVALPVSTRARAIARSGHGSVLQDATAGRTHLLVLTEGAGVHGAVQEARPLTEVDHEVRRLLLILALVGGGGVVLAALLGRVVARAALAPISRFTARTEAITAEAQPARRIEVTGTGELARLAASFNAALEALERSVEAQRHLVADASHELRTPIASLRANIQVLEDADRLAPEERQALREDIVEELDELTLLVSDVVELARGAQPGDALDDVRLDLVIREIAARAGRRAADEVVLHLELEPTIVRGEPDRIGRAISNVVDNARKYGPRSGHVEVTLRDGILSVRDHGPGFADNDLPHVFERFYRSRSVRGKPGSGLGLAIVRQSAEAHGGWVQAANAPGGGALMRISFGPAEAVVDQRPISA